MKTLKDLTLVLALWGFIIVPWCVNIWKLGNCDFEASYKAEVIRGVGIFIPPMGWVTGWMSNDFLGE